MKYLILEDNAVGHHLEYLHHLASYITTKNKQDEYIFLLTPKFKEIWNLREWPNQFNIKYIFFENEVDHNLLVISENRLKKSYLLSKFLSDSIDKYNPDRVILTDLAPYLPALPLLIKKRKLINGIIYKIPRYRPHTNRFNRIRDRLMMAILAKSKSFNKIFLLNDEESPSWYNKLYKTERFSFLPDPINLKLTESIKTIRENEPIILFHGGVLGERKGTFKIIEAIKSLPNSYLHHYKLRLIGSAITEGDRRKIKTFVKEYENRMDIMYTDQFVSFEELKKELNNADYILIPYENWEQSSGMLGYAAVYRTPVIGPSNGLLGKIITDYSLGYALENLSSNSIKELLKTLTKVLKKSSIECKRYVQSRTIELFSEILLKE